MDLTIWLPLTVALALLGLGVMALARWHRRRDRRLRVVALQELYLRRVGLPRREARRALRRAVDRLLDKHPDKSLEWVLERLLDDLERPRDRQPS